MAMVVEGGGVKKFSPLTASTLKQYNDAFAEDERQRAIQRAKEVRERSKERTAYLKAMQAQAQAQGLGSGVDGHLFPNQSYASNANPTAAAGADEGAGDANANADAEIRRQRRRDRERAREKKEKRGRPLTQDEGGSWWPFSS